MVSNFVSIFMLFSLSYKILILKAHSRGIFAHDKGPRGKQYKPKVMKRIETYGLKTKLQSRGGQQILWRKIIKGKTGWTSMVPAP